MAFLTKFGTYFGLPPAQLGRIHFVAPSASYTVDGRAYSASDSNDGLSPERALLTLSQALTNITASAGEVIFLLEGTHTQTATIRIQKAGISILGQRPPTWDNGDAYAWSAKPKSKISWAGAAAPGFSIEAANVEVGYVTLIPAAGFSTVIFRAQTNVAPDALYMHDFCIDFSSQPPNLATLGIDFGYRADTAGLAGTAMGRLDQATAVATAYLSNFSIVSNGANGPGILTATCDVVVRNGRFLNRLGAWASPFTVATGTGFVHVLGCHWVGGSSGSIGTGVTGATAGSVGGKVYLSDCRFQGVTYSGAGMVSGARAISDFAVGVALSSECYVAGMATAYTNI